MASGYEDYLKLDKPPPPPPPPYSATVDYSEGGNKQSEDLKAESGSIPKETYCQEPEPGDLIEIFHGGNKHWAIYEEDGYVIHLTPKGITNWSDFFRKVITWTSKAVVKRELLKDVAGRNIYRVSNQLDHKYRARPVDKILSAAREKIGYEMNYSFWKNKCEQFVTYLRYGLICSESFCEGLKPGDMIEVFHTLHQHWAIYEGNGYVIHLDSISNTSRFEPQDRFLTKNSRALVKWELLKDVVKDCPYRVNNHLDSQHRPQPENKILSVAKENIGKNIEYNVQRKVSEQFVIYLRYGLEYSGLFRDEANPGDLIEIFYITFTHWAIYEGNGYVIHLTPTSKNPQTTSSRLWSLLSRRAEVKRELLKDVVEGYYYQVNNHSDNKYYSQSIDRILSDAKGKIGMRVKYVIWRNRCENFVNELRYGMVPTEKVDIYRG